jgi:uncharacterized membrane protein YqjE
MMVDNNRGESPLDDGVHTSPRVYDTPAYTTSSATVDGVGPEPSLGELISSLSEDFSTLVRKEIKLAKVETQESIAHASRSVTMMVAGGLIAYAGLIVLLLGLAVLVGQAINSYWLAGLLVGVVVIGVGAILLSSGRASLKQVTVTPEQTIETLKEDARFVKEKVL